VTSDHVTLHVWRVPRRRVVGALWRVARDRRRLRRAPGVRFAKLLGTGAGRHFGAGRTDLTRWAAVIAWDGPDSAAGFDHTPVGRAWQALTSASCRLELRPVASRGSWAGQVPFATSTDGATSTEGATSPEGATSTEGATPTGPVLALTRARLRPLRALRFWRAIEPVGTAAGQAPGLLAAFGVGEAPVGWQGTVSLWRSGRDLVEFAYRNPHHRDAIARTPTQRWYAEELFARFAVLSVTGDRDVIDWTADETDEPERTVSR
jgi:hypothetical protein